MKEKLVSISIIGIILAIYILAGKYLLPLIWPIIIGAAIGKLIHPIVYVLEKYLRLGGGFASAVVLTVVLGLIGGGMVLGVIGLLDYVEYIIVNREYYEDIVYNRFCNICCDIEDTLGIKQGQLADNIMSSWGRGIEGATKNATEKYIKGGLRIFKAAAQVFVGIAVSYISGIIVARDLDVFRRKMKESELGKDIWYIYKSVRDIVLTSLKAQIIIMIITAGVCSGAFAIVRVENPVVFGIVVGLLDILPMIGVGLVLIPWAVIMVIEGKYFVGAVLFAAFIVCTIIREGLEPKLVGDKIGIHPLMAVISLYVGFRLFGVIGFLLGPIGYVFTKTTYELVRKN